MDFLKKNGFPLAAYLFAGYSFLQVFNTSGHFLSIFGLLAVIFLTVMLFMKRRDILLLAAAAAPAVINLLALFFGGSFWDLLVSLVIAAFVACFTLPQLEPYVGKYMDLLKKFWYIPGALMALTALFTFIGMIRAFFIIIPYSFWYALQAFNIFTILRVLLNAAAYAMLGYWLANPDGPIIPELLTGKGSAASASTNNPATGTYANTAAPAEGSIHFSMVAHILLLFFLGGIWLYIWIYKVTRYLNRVPGEEQRNPVTKLLLCMFVPFYAIYWTYKSAQRIDKLAGMKGIPSDISTLCLVLAIFVGIVPPILMQDKLNKIEEAGGAPVNNGYAAPAYTPAPAQPVQPVQYTQPAPQPAQPMQYADPFAQPAQPVQPVSQPAVDNIAELQKYKSLLDSGIISQEEFDAKKKQLLGL